MGENLIDFFFFFVCSVLFLTLSYITQPWQDLKRYARILPFYIWRNEKVSLQLCCNYFCLWIQALKQDCLLFVCMVSKMLFNIITCFLLEIDTGFHQICKIYSIFKDLSKDPKGRLFDFNNFRPLFATCLLVYINEEARSPSSSSSKMNCRIDQNNINKWRLKKSNINLLFIKFYTIGQKNRTFEYISR